MIIAILFQDCKLIAGTNLKSTGASSLAKASDAKALDKNPASVIPI